MSRLRIALPPLHGLTPDSELAFARLDNSGQVAESGHSTFQQLGLSARQESAECFLHPSDTVLTRLELPPLSAARTRAAVECAVQALTLGGAQNMHIAHGRRGLDGQVQVGWLPKAALERLNQVLSISRLKLGGLFPAPYRLALPPAGQLSASLDDEHLVLRESLEHGAVEPMVEDHLNRLQMSGRVLHWVGENATDPVAVNQRWSGLTPGWGLHSLGSKPAADTKGWGRALACCALAIGVWVVGLNLYAAREAGQGQQLKAQMSQRVKQAFPELPVILNPLQQARQQLAARQSGTSDGAASPFSQMVRQAGNALPSMAGSVQRLAFVQGQLQLELAAQTPTLLADEAALAQAGLAATRTGNVWTLSAAAAADDTGNRMESSDE